MLRALAATANVPWASVHLLQVDERIAPAGDPDRNLTHLRESLLDRVPLPPEQVHAMPVESPDPEVAAARYAATLREVAGTPPVLDLVHLGLGPDGHTASLVPGDPVLDVADADVALTGVVPGPAPDDADVPGHRPRAAHPVAGDRRREGGDARAPAAARSRNPGRARAPGRRARARRSRRGGSVDGPDRGRGPRARPELPARRRARSRRRQLQRVFASTPRRSSFCLFDRADDATPARVIELDPRAHRTYHYWHAFVPDVGPGQLYAYRAHGPFEPDEGLRFDPDKVLLDPYGRCVARPAGWSRAAACRPGDNAATALKSVVVDSARYDWEGDAPPRRPFAKTVIYELHVGGFTRHPEFGCRAGAARDVRRPDREDPVPAGPRRHRRRAAAGVRVRRAGGAAGARELLGLPAGRRSSRRIPPTARAPIRSARSTSSATW